MSRLETFPVGETDDLHRVGDWACNVGWCTGRDFPRACKEDGCPGLVHVSFGDESYEGYWLYEKCDVHERQMEASDGE